MTIQRMMTRNVCPVVLLLIAFSSVATSFSSSEFDPRVGRTFVSRSLPRRVSNSFEHRLQPLTALSSDPNGDASSERIPILSSPSPVPVPASVTRPTKSHRRVMSIQKNARLPVWPAWNGVLIWAVNRVLGDAAAAKLEDTITGRVCPNFFEYTETSPFIMLVHHCHSFAPWDPLRFFQRTFFPEGFPAHPHRGFVVSRERREHNVSIVSFRSLTN
jgi:hypothetical protein